LTLKHDGLKLLIMIRLCPLPFSITNGALSSVPTVSWSSFLLATAIASPKLLLHVWVGAQMAEIADKGDKMPLGTRVVSYIGIVIGSVAGAATGWWIYKKTKERAAELEELERLEGGEGVAQEYEDEPGLEEAAELIREEDDDISLRSAWDDEVEFRDDGSEREEESEDGQRK
jgi:golgi apparatus membrane protein TVP38